MLFQKIGLIVFLFLLVEGITKPMGDLVKIQKHFEWGEYDSLLSTVPTLITKDSLRFTKSQNAWLLAVLGLAHHAEGDSLHAALLYHQALSIDGQIVLDSFFVKPELLDFFKAKKSAYKANTVHHPKNTGHISAGTGSADSHTSISQIQSQVPNNQSNRLKTWKYTNWSMAGISLVLAAVAGQQFYEFIKNLNLLKKAAKHEPGLDFNHLDKKVTENWSNFVVIGSTAFACAVATGYSSFLFRKRLSKNFTQNAAVHFYFHNYGLGLAYKARF